MENNIKNLISLAEEHGNLILLGESKKANKIHKELSISLEAFKNDFKELRPLLSQKNESVKLWISSFLLKNGDLKGKKALEELSNSNSIFSTSANILLDLYKKGMLK